MEIQVDNRQNHYTIDYKDVQKKARTILEAIECPEAELSILIVTDDEMAKLNQTYLNRSGPTNVIAFPMREGPFADVNPNLLGDVVICPHRADIEAREAGITPEIRFDQLLIHGILHLFGFDHEKRPEKAEIMRAKEEKLLSLLQSENSLNDDKIVKSPQTDDTVKSSRCKARVLS